MDFVCKQLGQNKLKILLKNLILELKEGSSLSQIDNVILFKKQFVEERYIV